jgi:4-carboxymuconolactone decarboxylase
LSRHANKRGANAKSEANRSPGIYGARTDRWKRRGDRRHPQLDAGEANDDDDDDDHGPGDDYPVDHDALDYDTVQDDTEVVCTEGHDRQLSALVLVFDRGEHELLTSGLLPSPARSSSLPPAGGGSFGASSLRGEVSVAARGDDYRRSVRPDPRSAAFWPGTPERGLCMAETTETPVLDLLAKMNADAIEVSSLDPQTLALVRIAALIAVDAPAVSYALNLALADELEVEPEQIQGVLAAVAPIVGTARVVSASAKIVEGLVIDLEVAELEAESEEQA